MMTFRFGRRGIDLFNSQRIVFLFWLFLLVFPKGGFKLSSIPITWGYLLLGLVSFCIHFLRNSYTIHSSRYLSFLFLIPFQVVSAAHLLFNGFNATGMTVSFFISFFFLPYVFFLLLSENIETLNLDHFFRLFKKGILFISVYGIFLFTFKQVNGKFIEIPLLTTNLSDLGQLEWKYNNRGFVFKLISTYNNGNLYGICLLIFLPLYCYLETSAWRKAIVKMSLFLTFSRTAWIGLLFHELCYNWFVEKKTKRIINILKILSFIVFVMMSPFPCCKFLFSFVLDSSLGERTKQFSTLQGLSLFSSQAFEGIGEIVYLGILYLFGVVGLVAFLIAMTGSWMVQLSRGSLNKLQISMCLGIVNYLFISTSDGGILYLPVMAFFWFLCSLLARRDIKSPFIPSNASSA